MDRLTANFLPVLIIHNIRTSCRQVWSAADNWSISIRSRPCYDVDESVHKVLALHPMPGCFRWNCDRISLLTSSCGRWTILPQETTACHGHHHKWISSRWNTVPYHPRPDAQSSWHLVRLDATNHRLSWLVHGHPRNTINQTTYASSSGNLFTTQSFLKPSVRTAGVWTFLYCFWRLHSKCRLSINIPN